MNSLFLLNVPSRQEPVYPESLGDGRAKKMEKSSGRKFTKDRGLQCEFPVCMCTCVKPQFPANPHQVKR